jgi:hypothetical protein
MTAASLMMLAFEKFKVIEGAGEWMKKSESELKFIAMEARLEEANKKLTANTTKIKKDKTKDKTVATGRVQDAKWAWKNVIKAGDEGKEKTFEGKVYVHCPYHGETKWVLKVNREGVNHLAGCRKNPSFTGNVATQSTSVQAPTQSQLTYARALAQIMEADDAAAVTEED